MKKTLKNNSLKSAKKQAIKCQPPQWLGSQCQHPCSFRCQPQAPACLNQCNSTPIIWLCSSQPNSFSSQPLYRCLNLHHRYKNNKSPWISMMLLPKCKLQASKNKKSAISTRTITNTKNTEMNMETIMAKMMIMMISSHDSLKAVSLRQTISSIKWICKLWTPQLSLVWSSNWRWTIQTWSRIPWVKMKSVFWINLPILCSSNPAQTSIDPTFSNMMMKTNTDNKTRRSSLMQELIRPVI